MRALILSVSAGGGHINAAEAIENHIKLNNPHSLVKLVDTIKYINPFLDKVVIGSYLKSLKFSPSIFGKLYNLAETEEGFANFSSKINLMIIHKLMPLITDFNPDVIITTHPFSTEMISILRAKGKISIPNVTVLTDYAPHSFWIHPYVDAYVVSNNEMAEEMYRRGVAFQTVHPIGIPVKPQFFSVFPKEETLKCLNLNSQKDTILLMGGSLGLGKILDLYNELLEIKKDIQIIVITGNNKKLYGKLSELSKTSNKDTRIVGFTNEVNRYMQASDLLITKPGGLTITEALICQTPMALFSVIPGQEEKNAEFLIKNDMAIDLGDIKNCSKKIEQLLLSKNKLEIMKKNCLIFNKPDCGKNIYNLLVTLINQRQNRKTDQF